MNSEVSETLKDDAESRDMGILVTYKVAHKSFHTTMSLKVNVKTKGFFFLT